MKQTAVPALFLCLVLFTACVPESGTFDASGTFETVEVIVSSEMTGRILGLDVEEGDRIKEGQTVATIDAVQLELRRAQLRAMIRGAESRRPDIGIQTGAVSQQLETARTEKIRIENLLKSDAASRKQLDDIAAQISSLEKELAAQRSSLEGNSRAISEDSSALEIQIAQLDDQIARCAVKSPIEGTVLVKYAERGEFATAGKPLFLVADMDRMFLRAYITAAQLSGVKNGQAVTVHVDSGEKEYRPYPGKIVWVSGKAEFTPKTVQTRDERANLVYAVKAAVVNDGYLKIGMYGSLSLSGE